MRSRWLDATEKTLFFFWGGQPAAPSGAGGGGTTDGAGVMPPEEDRRRVARWRSVGRVKLRGHVVSRTHEVGSRRRSAGRLPVVVGGTAATIVGRVHTSRAHVFAGRNWKDEAEAMLALGLG